MSSKTIDMLDKDELTVTHAQLVRSSATAQRNLKEVAA